MEYFKRMKKIITFLLIVLIVTSCKEDAKQKTESLLKIDEQKSYELIFQVLVDEKNDYLKTNCILENGLISTITTQKS